MTAAENQHYLTGDYEPGPAENIVAYVHSGGWDEYMSEDVRVRLYTSLNDALALCGTSARDVVVVLPGHTENISSADQMSNLVAGTTIVGLGRGNLRPTFTWSAATATWLLDVANVTLENLILEMAGDPESTTALSVTAPMTVSASGCTIRRCRIQTAVDANQQADIGISVSADGDFLTLDDCYVHGAGDGSGITTGIQLVGADHFRMRGCIVDMATSTTTVGVLQLAVTASEQVQVERCTFVNRKASSVHAVTGMTGATGNFIDCNFGILDNTTTAGAETEGDLMFFNCHVVNLAGEASTEKTPRSA